MINVCCCCSPCCCSSSCCYCCWSCPHSCKMSATVFHSSNASPPPPSLSRLVSCFYFVFRFLFHLFLSVDSKLLSILLGKFCGDFVANLNAWLPRLGETCGGGGEPKSYFTYFEYEIMRGKHLHSFWMATSAAMGSKLFLAIRFKLGNFLVKFHKIQIASTRVPLENFS